MLREALSQSDTSALSYKMVIGESSFLKNHLVRSKCIPANLFLKSLLFIPHKERLTPRMTPLADPSKSLLA